MDKKNIKMIAGGMFLLFLLWGPAGRLMTGLLPLELNQVALMLVTKGLLAVLMVGAMWHFGGWRYFGMAGCKSWWFLLPSLPFILLTLGLLLNPEASFGLSAGAMLGWSLVSLFVGISEEALFRGILWRAAEPRGLLITSLVTSLLFGAVHLSGLLAGYPWQIIASQAVFATGVGMMFAAVRIVSGSLAVPILLHTIFDAAAIIAAGGVREMFDETMTPERLLIPGIAFFLWGLACILVIRWRHARALLAGHQ